MKSPSSPPLERIALLVCALLCAAPLSAQADDTTKLPKLEILNFGLIGVMGKNEEHSANTPSGRVKTGSGAFIQQRTHRVTTKLGQSFGILYQLIDAPGRIDLTVQWQSPVITNPETGEQRSQWSYQQAVSPGDVRAVGYGFDSKWEAVPGTWLVELRYRGIPLASQAFTVVEP